MRFRNEPQQDNDQSQADGEDVEAHALMAQSERTQQDTREQNEEPAAER